MTEITDTNTMAMLDAFNRHIKTINGPTSTDRKGRTASRAILFKAFKWGWNNPIVRPDHREQP